jgi:hypothetical protein
MSVPLLQMLEEFLGEASPALMESKAIKFGNPIFCDELPFPPNPEK